MGQDAVDLAAQRIEIGEIHHPDRTASDLVLVGRTDAAPRRADLRAAVGGRILAHAVQFPVEREDQGRIVSDAQVIRGYRHALLRQLVDLGDQRMRVHHDPIADDGHLPGTHDARGQQGQLIADAVDHEGMTGIVPALEAHDDVGTLREPVHDLALALVTPLGADYHDVRHLSLSCFRASSCANSNRRIYKA